MAMVDQIDGETTMSFSSRRNAFRAILAGDGCVHPASVFDPISGRIAEELGFSCAILAGSTASLAVLGAPDIVVLTLSEFADLIGRITRACAIPLLVDADHGYGNAQNVMRTVVELERVGVAALTIEDTDLPTRFGTAAPALTSREEGLGKMRAALAARSDPSTVVIGRTSAVAIAGLDEAVARARLYAEAGVDALFFTGVSDFAQVKAIRDAVALPIVLGGGGSLDAGALAALGVRVSLKGHQPIHAAFQAVYDAMLALRDGTALPKLAGAGLMGRVTRAEEYSRSAALYGGAAG
jgi:carboxyvinyl-carboxyphosphonate phosphorylmutase